MPVGTCPVMVLSQTTNTQTHSQIGLHYMCMYVDLFMI